MDVFESFTLQQIPAILAGLSCYAVRFGIIVAGISMLFSGITFLVARGNPVAHEQAKKIFFYSLLGALVVYGVYTIILSISLLLTGSVNLPWVPLTCNS